MAKNKKLTKREMEIYKKAGEKLTKGYPSQDTMKAYKKASLKKVVGKRTVGRVLGRAIPGAGTVLTAAEIAKMVKNRKAKPVKGKSCGPGKTKVTTGGKTYCVSGKKKFKKGSPVKDPISKR